MGTTDPQSAPIAPGIRASDADRERTAAALHTAASAGMLTLPEVDERSQLLYASRFHHELEFLVRDLPTDTPPERTSVVDGTLGDHVHAIWAALVGLLVACGALARKHPRITSAAVLTLAVALGVLLAFAGTDMHEHIQKTGTHLTPN